MLHEDKVLLMRQRAVTFIIRDNVMCDLSFCANYERDVRYCECYMKGLLFLRKRAIFKKDDVLFAIFDLVLIKDKLMFAIFDLVLIYMKVYNVRYFS